MKIQHVSIVGAVLLGMGLTTGCVEPVDESQHDESVPEWVTDKSDKYGKWTALRFDDPGPDYCSRDIAPHIRNLYTKETDGFSWIGEPEEKVSEIYFDWWGCQGGKAAFWGNFIGTFQVTSGSGAGRYTAWLTGDMSLRSKMHGGDKAATDNNAVFAIDYAASTPSEDGAQLITVKLRKPLGYNTSQLLSNSIGMYMSGRLDQQ